MTNSIDCNGSVRLPILTQALVMVVALTLYLPGCRKTEAARAETHDEAAKSGIPLTLPANANAIERTLFQKAPDCHRCAEANCSDFMAACMDIAGVASEGPAKGTPKAELCQRTVSCVFTQNCVKGDASFKCYCGKLAGEDCLTTNAADGPCRSVIEAGLESTSPGTIARVWGEKTRGAGAAMALVHCLVDRDCKTCF